MNGASQNFTNPSDDSLNPPLWDTIALGIIASLALMGNGTVIYLICTRKNLHKPASPNWFVLSLAIADLCVGAVYAPTRFMCFFAVSCSYMTWNVIYFFQGVFLSASVTNLCALTFDRYLAVVHPFTYRNSMLTSTRVYHLIYSSWLVALVLNIPYLVTTFLPHVNQDNARFVHTVAYMVIFAFIPSVFMIYAYISITIVIRKHRQVIKKQEQQIALNFGQEIKDKRHHHFKDETMKAVGVIVAVFIGCSGLYQWVTICSLRVTCEMPSTPAYFTIFTLLHFKSAINFLVYALLRKDFQVELRKICCRRQNQLLRA